MTDFTTFTYKVYDTKTNEILYEVTRTRYKGDALNKALEFYHKLKDKTDIKLQGPADTIIDPKHGYYIIVDKTSKNRVYYCLDLYRAQRRFVRNKPLSNFKFKFNTRSEWHNL